MTTGTSGTLRYSMVVRHPDTGEATALREGESVPDWAADLVHDDDLDGPAKPAKKAASSKTSK